MSYSKAIKEDVISLRIKGYSFAEIAKNLKLPRGTVYSWSHTIVLDQTAQTRINNLRQNSREKTRDWFRKKGETNQQVIKAEATIILSRVDLTTSQIQVLAAFLFWAEGSKSLSNVSFMNSDPIMIGVFLKLFRAGFRLTESKFRVLLHLHEYHDESKMISYWSTITGIPTSQFTKTYLKPHTKRRQHPNYMGCCKIKYYDAHIARLLNGIYNTFAEKVLGV